MAHIVSSPRPEVALTRDVGGGPALLIDFRTHEWIELSDEATAVVEIDSKLNCSSVERARANGITAAVNEVELFVNLALGAETPERFETERAVLETFADIAVRSWFEDERQRQ